MDQRVRDAVGAWVVWVWGVTGAGTLRVYILSGREPARDIAWPVSCQLGSTAIGEKACVYRAVVKTENQAATV